MSDTITLKTPLYQLESFKNVNVEGFLNKLKNIGLLDNYLKKTKKAIPYIETDAYKNNPIVFSSNKDSEIKDFLDSLKNK